MLEQFHFLRPWWLLLIVGAVFLWWWHKRGALSSNWEHVIDPHLRAHVLVGKQQHVSRYWLPLFMTMLALALAGPTVQKIDSESNLVKRPLVVLLELSPHMLASDISPSRLKRALFKLSDVLLRHKEREVALIVFAGDAHVVTPLTLDHETIITLSEGLDPSIMPIGGTQVLAGLREATQVGQLQADIVVITSSNFDEPADEVNNFINQHHLSPLFWVFATEAGAPLVHADGRFAPHQGSVQISQRREDILKQLARNARVSVVQATSDDADERVISAYLATDVRESQEAALRFDTWQDLGPYLLLVAVVLFLAASFFHGPGWLMLGMVLLVLCPQVKANSFSDWFLRADQRAYRALQQNEAEKAAELYTDPFAKGSALYKAKNYQAAASVLSGVASSDGRYNLGNALAHLNKLPEAIKAYEEALKLDANNADAKHNKEVLEKLLENQKEQQQQKEQQEQQKDNEQKQDKQSQQKNEAGSNENSAEEPKNQSGSGEKSPEEEKNSEGKQNKEQASEPKKPEQKEDGSAQAQPPQEKKDASKQALEPGAKAGESEHVDPMTKHYFEQIEEHSNFYLKRKFHKESQKKLEGSP